VSRETAHIWYEPASDVAGIVYGGGGSAALPPRTISVEPDLDGVELAFVDGDLVRARLIGATLERDDDWRARVRLLVGEEVYEAISAAAEAFAERRSFEVGQELVPAVADARERALVSEDRDPPRSVEAAGVTTVPRGARALASSMDEVRNDAFLAALARRLLLGQRVWSLDVVSARTPDQEERWTEYAHRAAADVVDLTVELPDVALEAGPDRLVALLRPALDRVGVILTDVDEELDAWRARVADAQLLEELRAQTIVPEVAATRPMSAPRAAPVGPELVTRRLCEPDSFADRVESDEGTQVRIPLDPFLADVVRRIREVVVAAPAPHDGEPEGDAVTLLTYWLLRARLRTIAPATWPAPPPRVVATNALVRGSVPWDAVFPPVHVVVLDDRGWPTSRTTAVIRSDGGEEVLTARVPGWPSQMVLTCTPHRADGVTAVGRAELWAPLASHEAGRIIPDGLAFPGSAVTAPFVRHITELRDDLLAVALDQLGPTSEVAELDEVRLTRRVDEASRWLGIIRSLDAWGPA
jgi:hypothetical protein